MHRYRPSPPRRRFATLIKPGGARVRSHGRKCLARHPALPERPAGMRKNGFTSSHAWPPTMRRDQDGEGRVGLGRERCRERRNRSGPVPGRGYQPLAGELTSLAWGGNLLVPGSRHRGRLRRLAPGSVARACARRADCPVVIVPEPPPRVLRASLLVGSVRGYWFRWAPHCGAAGMRGTSAPPAQLPSWPCRCCPSWRSAAGEPKRRSAAAYSRASRRQRSTYRT